MTNLDRQWAESQIEAYVDGSLAPDAARRMREVVRGDRGLRRQVDDALALKRELKRLRGVQVPGGLMFRLLGIPAQARPARFGLIPAAGVAALAVVVLSVGVFSFIHQEAVEARTQAAAIRDFQIAMVYLQRSTALAQSEVNEAVSLGLREAVETSRTALDETRSKLNVGERQNVD